MQIMQMIHVDIRKLFVKWALSCENLVSPLEWEGSAVPTPSRAVA